MNDASIAADLDLARAGDRQALDRLLERTHARLQRLTDERLGPKLRAKLNTSDILQSTYLEVIRGVVDFDGETEDAFFGWVGQILENNIRMKGRFYNAQKRVEPRELPTRLAERRPDEPTPSTELTRAEDLLLVSRALDGLSDDYRRIILLRVMEGKSHEEISRVMKRPVTATRMLLSRARAALSLEIERLDAAH